MLQKLFLAQLPTPIEEITSPVDHVRLFLKRDDFTGSEVSGNKIRKLEYSLAHAIHNGYDTIITTGAIHSNHCRATAAACAKLGLSCIVYLHPMPEGPLNSNALLDTLFGAEVNFMSEEEYKINFPTVLRDRMNALELEDKKAMYIPLGASDAIGTLGYYHAFDEILQYEENNNLQFDAICCTVGSGGTYAGLLFRAMHLETPHKVIGIPISESADYFHERVMEIGRDFVHQLDTPLTIDEERILLIDGKQGDGYGKNTPDDIAFIRKFASEEGILLDPVYTGKAMKGLLEALEEGHPYLEGVKNVLFIHTGGHFGVFGAPEKFAE